MKRQQTSPVRETFKTRSVAVAKRRKQTTSQAKRNGRRRVDTKVVVVQAPKLALDYAHKEAARIGGRVVVTSKGEVLVVNQ